MVGRIEDYAIVGDMQSVALIGTDGSADWLCLPRFDSEACGHAEEHRRGPRYPGDERRSVPG